MLSKRVNQLFFSLAMVLSLLVSAASACACSHHQPEAEPEQPSCHSATHGGPAAETVEPATPERFGPGCECFTSTPAPAITAKWESKKATAEKAVKAVGAASPFFGLPRPMPIAAVLKFEPPELSFIGRPLTAGPSRAPPRLYIHTR